jgi:hypothetical protein
MIINKPVSKVNAHATNKTNATSTTVNPKEF